MFQNLKEDWITYERDLTRPGLWSMVVYRFGQWRYTIPNRWLRVPFSALYKYLKMTTQMATGIELPCEAKLGKRVRIDHFGDIIISGDAVIGDDVVIRNGVTIGLKNSPSRGSPKIGNRVDIGAGAKILGPITIGDDVIIGANAVVIKDVPANHLAVGVPAEIRPRKAGL
jgi:serine O-acetyltransferase